MPTINAKLDLDLVSAIWILASNDENALISYTGLKYRLGLPPDFDIISTVGARRELFRPGASEKQVEAWKNDMRLGKRLPGWIKAIPLGPVRLTAIDAITTSDIFRSQFRATQNAERSPIEIIKWGLEHLDRLRKAQMDTTESVAKRWQMWLVFITTIIGIASQFIIAFAK